jgi:hypothetical protein
MVYPGRPGHGESALREGSLVGLLPGLRDCPGARPKATGQARWGTGVWMSAVPGAGVGRGRVMKVAAIAAAQANAAAQIQLIWAKLDRNCAGSA